jgi:hypothetical protein
MKNMKTVTILRCGVCCGRPDGDKLFRNSEDRAVRSPYIYILRNIKIVRRGIGWD